MLCGNSYINVWFEKWLIVVKELGVYKGFVVGWIVDIDIDEIVFCFEVVFIKEMFMEEGWVNRWYFLLNI